VMCVYRPRYVHRLAISYGPLLMDAKSGWPSVPVCGCVYEFVYCVCVSVCLCVVYCVPWLAGVAYLSWAMDFALKPS
jgi:hypothetical protein